ncbi:MAG: glycosyltransferase family 4 protein [Candidatus Parcubacteria bacterium]|nr:glycosyltransferase family 4 protein [Candidatus Parcubacteria bacterium]
MKIIFITSKINLVTGGGSNYCLDLKLRFLQAKGYDVSVITFYSKGNEFFSTPPYKIIKRDIKGHNLFLRQWQVFKVLEEFSLETDLFFIEGPSFLWGAGLYRKLGKKVPVAVNLNNYSSIVEDLYKKPPLYGIDSGIKFLRHKIRMLLERTIGLMLFNSIDIFFCPPSVAKIYQEAGFLKEKFRIIPDFIDIESLQNEKNLTVKDTDYFNILYAGRLDFDKGVDILIKAFSLIGNKDSRLHIVGDGPEKERLEALVRDSGLGNSVIFHSWVKREDLFHFYFQSDLFVHPARWPEPFGLAVIEAMAFGLPVVVADSLQWLVSDSGIVFKRGDIKDLAGKISSLMTNRNKMQEMSEKGPKKAREYDYRNYAEEFEESLNNFVKR